VSATVFSFRKRGQKMNTVAQATALAKSMVSGKYRYLYGAKGELYTTALVNKLAAKYPSVFTASLKAEALKDADKGYYAIDCSGFICDVLGISDMGSAQLKSTAVKVLSVSKANAQEGMILWKSSHVAYVGADLKIYEAKSTASDLTVSTWASRASAFTYLLVVKGSALASSTTTTTTTTTATSSTSYYAKYTGTSSSLVTALAAVGEKDTSYTHRKKIAVANGISNYSGKASQNTTLLNLLKNGKLIKA